MANLTSTQSGAWDAMLGLLQTAATGTSNPTVAVVDSYLLQYEPACYVILSSIEQHTFDIAALGSYAFEETYQLCGQTTYLQGNTDVKTVRDTVFSVHESIVQTTLVANRGQNGIPVLGSSGPAALLWCIPAFQRFTMSPANFSGGASGVQGTIEWAYEVKARITTA